MSSTRSEDYYNQRGCDEIVQSFIEGIEDEIVKR